MQKSDKYGNTLSVGSPMKDEMRFKLLSVIIILCFGMAALKLAHTSLFPDERLKTAVTHRAVPRGVIFDRKGRLLAGASMTRSLFARSSKISPELKLYIKTVLGNTGYFSAEELSGLDKDDKSFVYIKRGMTPSITEPVLALMDEIKKNGWMKGEGLGLDSEESRFNPYPFLEPVVGVLGRDGKGLSGIEFTMNNVLDQGDSISLTIDAEFSRIAYEELMKGVSTAEADGGSVAIMDIESRSLLALVQSQGGQNYAMGYNYEPGSVMKIFAASFAMETGLATTSEPLFNDRDPYRIGDYTFDKTAYGMIPLSVMLQKSANISFARMSAQFGADDYHRWLTELGFGRKPKLPLTSLEKGILHPPSKWSALSKPMITIGQEIGVTTLQLVQAASIIAGQGEAIDPILIQSVRSPKGEEKLIIERERMRLMHPQKARELVYALENAVKPGGTGAKAAVEGIRIAGKTGTGMIAEVGGYSQGRNNTVFIGFFPVDNPKIAVVVAVHNPKGSSSRFGGGVSAPLFAEIVRRLSIVSPN